LELDGERIAFDFGLEFDCTRWVMKIGFDPKYQRLSPGSVLRAFEIEQAFQDETRRYELLGAARGTRNDWKLRWTSQQHDLVRVQVFDRSLSGRLLWARESQWKPLVSAVGDRARKSMGPETRKKLNRAMAPLKRARGARGR
jgi:hypothetical protein